MKLPPPNSSLYHQSSEKTPESQTMHAAAVFHDTPDDRIGRFLHRFYYFGVEDEFPFFVRLRLELCQFDHSPILSP